jgi:Ran GTPase-activating protein (RanGAP) involved in mRNA processing and transport
MHSCDWIVGLENLDLSHNKIAGSGAQELCQALQRCVPLRNLNLANNLLSDQAGTAFASLLLPSSAAELSSLQLSGNCSIGSVTAARLAQALPYSTSLQRLELSHTNVGMRQW